MTLEEVKIKHPSLCYDCSLARKPASDENTLKGWVGCAGPIAKNYEDNQNFVYGVVVKDELSLGEGWVDLRSSPKLGKGSGIITNFQLLCKEVKSCKHFEENGI